MRLFPLLAGFMLISATALAQPGPGGPGPDPSMQPPADQGPPPPPDQGPPPPDQQRPPPHQHGDFRQKFEAANVTRDGRLTQEQAQQAGMHAIARHFQEIDVDRKGYVTMQDVHAWQRARRQARQQQSAPPQQQ